MANESHDHVNRKETINRELDNEFTIDWGASIAPDEGDDDLAVVYLSKQSSEPKKRGRISNVAPTTYSKMKEQLLYGDQERIQ